MTTLAIAHPKGGVGRSTTAYMLGYELARAGCRTLLVDLDQGRHLSRMLQLYPPGLDNLAWLAPSESAVAVHVPPTSAWDVVLFDTAPEANPRTLRRIVGEADALLVPVKGPEAGSVQVLPEFLRWVEGSRLLGFVPTMHHARRAEHRRWLDELHALADQHNSRVFDPIPDLAALAAWRVDGHPYRRVAREVRDAIG